MATVTAAVMAAGISKPGEDSAATDLPASAEEDEVLVAPEDSRALEELDE